MSRETWQHARISRRTSVQAGAVGLLGLGMNHLGGIRTANAEDLDYPIVTGIRRQPKARPRTVLCSTIRNDTENAVLHAV